MRNLPTLDSWIPKGKHIYAIGVQNLLYQPPSQFTFGCKAHWFYHVQVYLGPQYTPVVWHDSETTNTIILVREDIINNISNVSVSIIVGS